MLGIMEINYLSENTMQISCLISQKSGHVKLCSPHYYFAPMLKNLEQKSSVRQGISISFYT